VTGLVRRWAVSLVAVVLWEPAARLGGSPFFPPPAEIAAAL
jgi:ABC-type nitrate/sulfonate/bicarbonate transport system permease component